jgi:pantoate--beta-alanine ligase
VVSIFVNPKQFGPNEDLERYPRALENDLEVCREAGVDMVFAPEPDGMYPPGFDTTVSVDGLSHVMCGKSRPGHFDGVCTVVCKLFNIITPESAYFGQKDIQQLTIIRRMVRDLHLPVEVVSCPIVREADGLALSSRNSYLNEQERLAALALRKSLLLAEEKIGLGERGSADIIKAMREVLEADPLVRADYIELMDPQDLRPVERVFGSALAAVAAFVGTTRLIDNMLIKAPA